MISVRRVMAGRHSAGGTNGRGSADVQIAHLVLKFHPVKPKAVQERCHGLREGVGSARKVDRQFCVALGRTSIPISTVIVQVIQTANATNKIAA